MTLTNVKTLMLIGILEVKVKDYEAVKKKAGGGDGGGDGGGGGGASNINFQDSILLPLYIKLFSV